MSKEDEKSDLIRLLCSTFQLLHHKLKLFSIGIKAKNRPIAINKYHGFTLKANVLL